MEAAQQYVENAIKYQEEAIKLSPENPSYLERLSGNHEYLARILDKRGLSEQANEHRQAAASLRAKAIPGMHSMPYNTRSAPP